MILASHGIIGSSISQFTSGLLDTYTGAAAAYSLRRLSIAYTGSAIRVRRADNNAEQDIGFVGENLDTSALTTFCSGTNGFVKTWYDQSGNANDATQLTAANQPQIVSSGSVILESGKSIIHFNDKSQSLQILGITPFTGFSHICVSIGTSLESNGFCHFIGLQDANGSALGIRPETFPVNVNRLRIYDFNGGIGNVNAPFGSIFINERALSYSQNINNEAELYKNGTLTSTATGTTTTLDDIIIGNSGNVNVTTGVGTKKIQEYILYPSDQSTNRTGISNNINSYYSIY